MKLLNKIRNSQRDLKFFVYSLSKCLPYKQPYASIAIEGAFLKTLKRSEKSGSSKDSHS